MSERKRAWEELARHEDLELVGSLRYNIEVNAAGVNKGTGLVNLGSRLGIKREEIMAFGDGDNDTVMLKEVGFGVAMANGEPQVKEAADYITLSNEEDGVAQAIERFVSRRRRSKMLEALKVIIFGIVEGITEWLPISSTGHLILLEELLHLKQNQAFLDMFYVVIQLGAILAVVVMYFHKLNPFSPKKTQKQKMLTIQLWVKVIIGSIPAMLIGLPFNDFIEEKFNNSYVVAANIDHLRYSVYRNRKLSER